MNQLPSEILPPMRADWIDRIWQRMHTRYGNKFLDMWRGLDMKAVKLAWAEDLAGYSGDELKCGLDWCKTQTWPPTLPEFMTACRLVADKRAEWAVACDQMRIRLQGKGEDKWSRPEVYWAAVAVGWYDLNATPWEQIKTRWANALENASSDPIPEYLAALPAPGKTTVQPDEAKKRIADAVATIKGPADYKAWAKKIVDNPSAHQFLAIKFAREALEMDG